MCFLNIDISLNMSIAFIHIDLPIIETMMEGTPSQIVDLGPSFYFMQCRILDMKKTKSYPLFETFLCHVHVIHVPSTPHLLFRIR